MSILSLILLVFAFVLLAVSSWWNPPRPQLGWLGLAFWVLAEILSRAGGGLH